MADESTDEMTGVPVFGDDRLLAFALGLDDDPQLVAAAAADEGLRRRLDAVRVEVEQVGAQVRAAVPTPDDDYTDLSDPRWAGMQEFFAPPPRPVRARGRASRWLRVLAPAAVALIAVAVGLAVINDRKGGDVALNGSLPAAAKATSEAAGPLTTAGETATDRAGDYAQALSEQLDRYAVVVLAEAKAASGAFQRFVVVKFLKGDGPEVVRLRVVDPPADEGRLQVLFLRPMLGGSAKISPKPTPAPVPSAAETTSTLATLTVGVPIMYSYQGEAAMARELPAGTDPATVTLP
ncbi:MAG: hypothetical protein NTX16_08810 [Actinobacteria bacterium]|nr:hypothetical protein [Actinomycetota bacterium]